MKRLASINVYIIIVLVLGACSASNNVVNNNLISKRKYEKGFHLNKKSKIAVEKDKIAKNTAMKTEETFDVSSLENLSFSQVLANGDGAVSSYSELDLILEGFAFESATSNGFAPVVVADTPELEASEAENSIQTDLQTVNSEKSVVKKNLKTTRKNQTNKKNQGSGGDEMFILAIIFAIIIPPLGVAIYTNIDWTKVLIALLLTFLLYLPGMIYALLVVFDVI